MAAGSEIGALFVRIGSDVSGLHSGLKQGEKDVTSFTGKINGVIGSIAKFGIALGAIGVAAVATGLYLAVRAAGDFQNKMTALKTGAGELQSNMALVSDGILKMAGDVGQSAGALADGMFMIESAGYHGAAGLAVLQAAAEGAKVGNADLATVADAVTTVLKDYHMKATQAADATNFLVSVVAQGKTHMQDLAGSLAMVLPFASALKVPLDQIGGAMATMTAKGIPAANAATYLRFTMAALANETPKGAKALKEIGLTADHVATTLTTKGLLPALQLIQEHLAKKFPQGGAKMFAALANIVGGTRGLGAALQLTGLNLKDFIASTHNVAKAIKEGHGHVIGWADVQKDLNFQVQAGVAAFGAAGIKIGMKLVPALTQLMGQVVPLIPKLADMGSALLDRVLPPTERFAGWLTTLGPQLKTASDTIKALAPYIAVLAGAWVVWNVALAVTKAIEMGILAVQFAAGIIAIVSKVGLWTAAQWLLNIAMDANPIGLIILGIALLTAGFIFAYTHSTPFRNFINSLWTDLKAFASWLGTVLQPIIKGIGDMFSGIGSGIQGIASAAHSMHIPGFALGGVVPGAIGAPMLAVVHGGERVQTPAQQAAGVGGGDMTGVASLLNAILNELRTPPGGQTGVEAALYKAVHLSGTNRARGMAGA